METTVTLENIFELEDAQAVQVLTSYLKYQVCKKDPQGSPFHYLAQIDGPVRPIAVGFFEELNGNNTDTLKESLRTPKSDLYKAVYGHYINRQLEHQPALYLLLPKHKRGMVALVKPTDSGLRVKGLFIGATEDRDIHIKFNLLRDSSPILRGLFVDTPNIDHLFYEPVKTAEELATELARITREIEQTIVDLYGDEPEEGFLHQLHQSFKTELLPLLKLQSDDPKEYGFAELYAETMSYGMFTALRFKPTNRLFERRSISDFIPPTNPFLRDLFKSISKDADERAQDEKYKPLFDHIEDLVGCLASTDMHAVLEDWNHDKTHDEDIVIHFYETFLNEFDKERKRDRGVYYTPSPVVSYIIRSVDSILKEKFNKPLGLADPEVLILDPATGTGTFLFHIFKHLENHYKTQMKGKPDDPGWDAYVDKHILPRLFGFELMMAPYAVAHLRMGVELQESGYTFASGQRLGIYMTNTLEETAKKSETLFEQYIASESDAATEIKREKPIMVVIGNPPYSGHSANNGNWIKGLVKDYYFCDGRPLGERNPKWLQDDYVKFIRFAQWRIEKTGFGILAFITNHGFINNPTFRGMRQHLTRSFNEISVLDLHGNLKKKETCPDGSKDANVFNIQQGVSINLLIKETAGNENSNVKNAHLWGLREIRDRERNLIGGKYKWLYENSLNTNATDASGVFPVDYEEVELLPPLYKFTTQDADIGKEFYSYWKLTDIFPVNVLGFQTHRDHFAITLDEADIRSRIDDFRNRKKSDDELKELYKLKDNRDWQLNIARRDVQGDQDWQRHFTLCAHRPFDFRYCYFSTVTMDYPRRELLDHVFQKENICLVSSRQQSTPGYQHAWVCKLPANDCLISTKSREANQVFPLYKWTSILGAPAVREPNINTKLIRFLEEKYGSPISSEDIFYYIYAVLNSDGYRARYIDFLFSDYPHIPFTENVELFQNLASLGKELTEIHCMDKLPDSPVTFPKKGNNLVEKIRFTLSSEGVGKVFINKEQHFLGITEELWNYMIGGHQVCESWLKVRKDRKLTESDVQHYIAIIGILIETNQIVAQIDDVIEEHGGWPIQ